MQRHRGVSAAGLTLAAFVIGCSRGGDSSAAVMTTTSEGRLIAPSAESAAKRGVSLIRIINAVPDAQTIDVTTKTGGLFGGVDFRAISPYAETRENIATFRVRTNGADASVQSANEIVADGSRYTVIALPGEERGVSLRVLHDELDAATGRARLRLVHGIRGEGDIELTVEGADEPLWKHVDFGSESGYREVDPVDKGVLIVREATGRVLLRKQTKLRADHTYTIVLTGNGSKRVDAIIVDDQPVAP